MWDLLAMISNSEKTNILLVDGDLGILSALERVLRKKRFNILCTQTANVKG